MGTRGKIALGVTLVVVTIAVCWAWGLFNVWRRLPEAYAAWDTGTLLVEYMHANESHWPSSWDDLFSVTNANPDIRLFLHGAEQGQTNYMETLPEKVLIDWSFTPSKDMDQQQLPVTRLNGAAFPVVWHDPNDMVREYPSTVGMTNAPDVR